MTSALRTRKRWRRKQSHQSSLEGFMFGNVEFQSRQIGVGGGLRGLPPPLLGIQEKKGNKMNIFQMKLPVIC